MFVSQFVTGDIQNIITSINIEKDWLLCNFYIFSIIFKNNCEGHPNQEWWQLLLNSSISIPEEKNDSIFIYYIINNIYQRSLKMLTSCIFRFLWKTTFTITFYYYMKLKNNYVLADILSNKWFYYFKEKMNLCCTLFNSVLTLFKIYINHLKT